MTADTTKKSILDYLLFTKYLPQIPRIGIRNLNRQKARTRATIIAVMFSLALSAALVTVVDMTNTEIPKSVNQCINWNVKASFHQPVSQAVIDTYESMSHVEEVEPFLEMVTMSTTNATSIIFLRAQSWNSSMTDHTFGEGHSFQTEETSECLINARLLHDLGLSNGDNITIWFYQMQLEFTIVGVSDSWAMPSAMVIQTEYLESIMGPTLRFNAMRMIVEEEYKDEIVDELNNEDPSISFAYDNEFFLKQTMGVVRIEQQIAYIAMILGFIVAFIAIFNTTFISSIERIREFAIMRAFGFSNGSLLQVSLIENVILTTAALFLGIAVSYPLAMAFLYLIEEFAQKVAFSFTWQTIWVTLVFAVGTTLVAVIPGWLTNTRQKLANNLREE